MDADELASARPDSPLYRLVREDLDPFSIEELDARIAALEGEIARTRARRDKAAAFRASADSLFGRP